jgi:hypothetical protein
MVHTAYMLGLVDCWLEAHDASRVVNAVGIGAVRTFSSDRLFVSEFSKKDIVLTTFT